MTITDFRTRLMTLADDSYREFTAKGIITGYPILGVRIPDLRALARQIIKDGSAGPFLEIAPTSFEEVTTQGIVIASLPYDKMRLRLPDFTDHIDNWCTCDTLANTAKSIKTHRDDFLAVIDRLLDKNTEFSVRTALVCLLTHYIAEGYLAVIFDRISRVARDDRYYVKMAAAWLLAECFIKFPDDTYPLLASRNFLPTWTHNKAISKIRDSYRIPDDVKSHLATLRK